jgi:hypothetical protein
MESCAAATTTPKRTTRRRQDEEDVVLYYVPICMQHLRNDVKCKGPTSDRMGRDAARYPASRTARCILSVGRPKQKKQRTTWVGPPGDALRVRAPSPACP